MRPRVLVLGAAGLATVAGAALALAVPSTAAGSLVATYTRVQEWPGAYFQGQYAVTNGTSAAVPSWTLTFTLPAGDALSNWWGATVSQSGSAFTATGGALAAGASLTFGFLVTEGGGLADPANCKLNGNPCAGGGTTSPSPTKSPTPTPTPTRTASPTPSPTPSATPTGTGGTSAWHPNYLAIGSIYTPYASVDAYFQGLAHKPTYGYRYLTGDDLGSWAATTTTLVTHARSLDMTPVLVEYGMNGNVDGSSVDYTNMQSTSWLTGYFQAVRNAARAAASAAAGTPVGWVIEPDMLGYLQQNYAASHGNDAGQFPAATGAAYSSGVLGTGDPTFANTLKGLVEAINYTIRKYDPTAFLGWQVNDWAVRNPLHDTDTMGVTAGRQSVTSVANQVAAFVGTADIGYHADFVAFDQWGQDFGILRDPNPAADVRYLNATHWTNYLLYVKTIRQALGLPAVLWQIPVGHLNASKAGFPALDDVTAGQYEDSASTFFYGDTFTSSGNNLAFFSANPAGDPKVSVSGGTVTWGSHLPEAAAAGVVAIMFGAGTGTGTEGVPEVPGISASAPTDFGYWAARTQQYLASPTSLP